MCKHGGTEGETRERALQGRKVVGSLESIMNGRSVSMEVNKDLRITLLVPTLTYASKTCAWNESQRSTIHIRPYDMLFFANIFQTKIRISMLLWQRLFHTLR